MGRQGALVIAVLGALIIAIGCNAITGTSNIEYRVIGTAQRVSLTYETEGGTAQVTTAIVPWSYSRKAKKGDFLYVSAQIIEGAGSATATIYKGGNVFKSSTSSGFGAIATASGALD